MYNNNKTCKISFAKNRKLKSKNYKSYQIKNNLHFHLDIQQDQASVNAKRQLEKFSQSFQWQSLSNKLKNHNNNQPHNQTAHQKFSHWEQYHQQISQSMHKIQRQSLQVQKNKYNHSFKFDQKKLTSNLRAKTHASNYSSNFQDQQQKLTTNLKNISQKRLLYADYKDQSQKTIQIGKSRGPSLNLSFNNITAINSPINTKIRNTQTHFYKSRPLTSKKQLDRSVVNVETYCQNGILKTKKTRRHLKTLSYAAQNNYKKQRQKQNSMRVSTYQINGLNIYKSKKDNHIINSDSKINNTQKLNQTQSSFYDNNLFLLTNYSYQAKGAIRSYIKCNRSVKKGNFKGKLISANCSKINVKRSFKIQEYSTLNKDFARITKLLKQQTKNLGICPTKPEKHQSK